MAKQKEKIQIAVDSDIVINLINFIDPKNDPDGIIHDLLEKRALQPAYFADYKKNDLPPLLRDRWFSKIVKSGDIEIYENLLDIYRLFKYVKEGIIELCITPTIFHELDYPHNEDFIKKYITVLKVRKEDAQAFYEKRNRIVDEYIENGIFVTEYNSYLHRELPPNDACASVEAALFGLYFYTANVKHFIQNKYANQKEYEISDKIKETHLRNSVIFKNNFGRDVTPGPKTISTLNSNVKRVLKKGGSLKEIGVDEPNIENENCKYFQDKNNIL